MSVVEEVLHKLRFITPIFQMPQVFLESGFKRSAGLSCVFHVAGGAGYLIYATFVVFILDCLVFYWQTSFDCVISGEGSHTFCVFKQFCDKTCFISSVFEFCPFYFLDIFFLFFCSFLLFNLLAVEASYLLLIRIYCILFLSFCRFWGVKLYVSIL